MQPQQTFVAANGEMRGAKPSLRALNLAKTRSVALDRSQALIHDLRGMIAIVASCAAALEAVGSGSGAPLSSELIDRILRACKTMTLFVDDCLSQAWLQGLQTSTGERLALMPLVSETVGLHQAAARQKNIAIDASFSTRHHTVRGSASLLQRALSNLLANAIKFSPQASTISLAVRDKAGAIQIIVADQGPGIPKAEQVTLFDPYVQGSNVPTAGERGFGLGLAIAKSLVEAQGGEITLSSEPGQGSVFAITLPL